MESIWKNKKAPNRIWFLSLPSIVFLTYSISLVLGNHSYNVHSHIEDNSLKKLQNENAFICIFRVEYLAMIVDHHIKQPAPIISPNQIIEIGENFVETHHYFTFCSSLKCLIPPF